MRCGVPGILRQPRLKKEVERPRPPDEPRLSSREWNGGPSARAEGKKRARRGKEAQARGPTGRQSGAAPVPVGLPAASNTDSWWAANRSLPSAAEGHQGKWPRESRL